VGKIYCQESIKPILLGEIPVGNGPGELAFNIRNQDICNNVPANFTFSDEGLLVIHDGGNARLQFYDPNTLTFKRSISVKFPCQTTAFFCGIGITWNIDFLFSTLRNEKMEVIKKIENSDDQPFYFLKNILWFSDKKNKIYGYDNKGELINNDQVIKLLKENNDKIFLDDKYNSDIRKSILEMIESGEYLIFEGKIYTRIYKQAKKFFGIISGFELDIDSSLFKSSDLSRRHDGEWYYGNNMAKDGLLYWSLPIETPRGQNPQKYYTCAFSESGKLLAYFNMDDINPAIIFKKAKADGIKSNFKENEYHYPIIEVSPNGDVYILVAYSKSVKIYRIDRKW